MDDTEQNNNAPVDIMAQNYNASAYWFIIATLIFFIGRVINIQMVF